jgi:hypothetical protein
VRHRRLAVGHVRAGLAQPVARLASELDPDDRVVGAVADGHREAGGIAELEAVDGRDEAAQRHDPRRPRATGAETERVRHHAPLREAAQHRPPVRDVVAREQVVEPAARQLEGRPEGLAVREADLPHDVPVRSARRQRQRPPGGGAEQAPIGIEQVEQREEVVLVGAAAVEEDERAVGVPVRGADAVG